MIRPMTMLVLALALQAFAGERQPTRVPSEAAKQVATRGGKYVTLLKWIEVPEDFEHYGELTDYGFWDGDEWAGYHVPKGYWVYVFPHWFIFARQAKAPPRVR